MRLVLLQLQRYGNIGLRKLVLKILLFQVSMTPNLNVHSPNAAEKHSNDIETKEKTSLQNYEQRSRKYQSASGIEELQ